MHILVTGATGFVGSHLARRLADDGHDVVAVGRQVYATGRIRHPRIRVVRAALEDKAAIVAACAGVDVVFHVGALSSPWGTRAQFESANVTGTAHVIAACEQQRVRRLVHVSSTSIFFAYGDREGLTDDAARATPFCNDYAASKAAAEDLVQAAVARGLDAVIVRARAVFGPGDAAIVPRVLTAARAGRLRQIGDGANRLDLTYVDNLVDALVLAIDRGERGAAFTITNDEPVAIWPLLREACLEAGIPPPTRQIAWPKLRRIARIAEAIYSRLPGRPEPPITEYGAGLLATTQTFDISAAKATLGYAPKVPVREGLSRTIRHLNARDDRPSTTSVKLTLLFTGYCMNWQHHVMAGTEHRRVPFHSMVAVIEHPRHGVTLVDAGYARHFHDETRRFPFFFYAMVTPVTSPPAQSAAAQLAARGIAPSSVDRVLITHFHGDHIAGLRDFPQADLLCTGDAWRSIAGRSGVDAVRRGHVPGLLPDDTARRLHLLERFDDAGIGPFARTHDLFGDGSVRLVPLPGHAAGQVGALVQAGPDRRVLLVADAAWTSRSYRERILPHPITRFITHRHRQYVEVLDQIRSFADAFPDIEIVPTHCPEVFARHGATPALPASVEDARQAAE
jgi:nucleoside-diphosphate-sugar epimerase/glyoxylase-like metal-dependent hydrolase (beta-lactamase superfamily II)